MQDLEIDSRLPLTPLSYHILLALADSPRHGYGIIKEIEAGTGGKMPPSTGALYLALQRMEEGALIEEAPDRPDPAQDDARRRYYRLTELGRAVARAETGRLAGLLAIAHHKGLIGAGVEGLPLSATGGGHEG